MTTSFDFDRTINRRGTDSVKYGIVDDDVLPLWVADMDFPAPQPVIDALHSRIDSGMFGYAMAPSTLAETICDYLLTKFNWQVKPEEIVFVPGVVAALNVAVHAYGSPGGSVLLQTPVYPPFFNAAPVAGQIIRSDELIRREEGNRLHYEIDFDSFEQAIDASMRMFVLCSPHNPVGRVWTRDELTRMAEICLKHDVIICSDEIHGDLVFEGHPHTPTASISPEIAAQTVTLMAPSKTFNIPGLGCSFAVIQNPELREQYDHVLHASGLHVSIPGYVGALAAYSECMPWLDALLTYLQANRDYTTAFFDEHLPGVRITHPEGTYLSWLDCREFSLHDESAEGIKRWLDPFFLKEARVALNNGQLFGTGGDGFARLNFALPRVMLTDALQRMREAILAIRNR